MLKPTIILSVGFGVLFVILAGLYFANPASNLPHFIPGYQAGLLKHHFTHAAGALLIGLGLFAFAWFQSGKKSSK